MATGGEIGYLYSDLSNTHTVYNMIAILGSEGWA